MAQGGRSLLVRSSVHHLLARMQVIPGNTRARSDIELVI